jgi:RNA polymerase sigma-70 factor, ECF subfamily
VNASMTGTANARDAFDRLLSELRPKLHRYCARMTGSVIDGEDVAQEALTKAIEAFPEAGTIARPESWLFRIAHNAALDFFAAPYPKVAARSDEDPDVSVDPAGVDPEIAAASLRTFMCLPVTQRSSLILMDMLGYSLQEIGVHGQQHSRHQGRAQSLPCASSRAGTAARRPSQSMPSSRLPTNHFGPGGKIPAQR